MRTPGPAVHARLRPAAAALLRLALALALALVPGCALSLENLSADGAGCETDDQCVRGLLCIVGTCVNPTAQNLDRVNVLVSPLGTTGLKPQPVEGLSIREATRRELSLRPTLPISVQACSDSACSTAGQLSGTLQLNAPSPIAGIAPVESVMLESGARGSVGLLEFNAYAPVLFPADERAPLLRGPAVFAAAGATTLDIQFPDPAARWLLSGTVVANASVAQPVGVAGMKVWVTQADTRLTRDVVTDAYGRFELRVLKSTSSALTLHVAPSDSTVSGPTLALPRINLDADRELDLVDLALPAERFGVGGVVRGPGGNTLAGAQVVLEGMVGSGVFRASGTTDAAGAFSVQVPRGTYTRVVLPLTAHDAALSSVDGLVVAAEVQEDVALGALPQVCGVVRTSRGVGVSGARVQLTRVGNAAGVTGPANAVTADVRVTTGSDGRYCGRVPPGRYLIAAQPQEGSSLPQRTDLIEVTADRTHDVALPRAAFLVGVARDPAGQPVALARIKAFSPAFSTPRGALELGETFTAEDGTFTLPVPDLTPEGFVTMGSQP